MEPYIFAIEIIILMNEFCTDSRLMTADFCVYYCISSCVCVSGTLGGAGKKAAVMYMGWEEIAHGIL